MLIRITNDLIVNHSEILLAEKKGASLMLHIRNRENWAPEFLVDYLNVLKVWEALEKAIDVDKKVL